MDVTFRFSKDKGEGVKRKPSIWYVTVDRGVKIKWSAKVASWRSCNNVEKWRLISVIFPLEMKKEKEESGEENGDTDE